MAEQVGIDDAATGNLIASLFEQLDRDRVRLHRVQLGFDLFCDLGFGHVLSLHIESGTRRAVYTRTQRRALPSFHAGE